MCGVEKPFLFFFFLFWMVVHLLILNVLNFLRSPPTRSPPRCSAPWCLWNGLWLTHVTYVCICMPHHHVTPQLDQFLFLFSLKIKWIVHPWPWSTLSTTSITQPADFVGHEFPVIWARVYLPKVIPFISDKR